MYIDTLAAAFAENGGFAGVVRLINSLTDDTLRLTLLHAIPASGPCQGPFHPRIIPDERLPADRHKRKDLPT